MKLLNEILGTKYPIIQGGMANIATGEFAAACSNAGALGLIGAGGMNADTLRQNIRRCKELTDKPFGVNIMLMHPQADEFAKIVVEEGVQVVTTGAGNPGKYVPMWKAAGIKVIPVVAAAVLAKHLEPLGIDAVIAEGTESGGHVGEMTTMALVPQVVDAVNVPVIAAGGIADGRQLAAALALGEGKCARVLMLTARTTGRKSAMDALAILRAHGARLLAVEIAAKDKVCPMEKRDCRPEVCPYAKGFYDRLPDALESALDGGNRGRGEIGALAQAHRLCPFELSLALSLIHI